MTTVVLLSLLGVYVVGVFPSAIWVVRQNAERGHCHHEDRHGGRDRFNNATRSWCSQFHRADCWRPEERVEYVDLKMAPLALVWPLLVLAAAVLRQANKKPSRRMLEARIARLERENGMSS